MDTTLLKKNNLKRMFANILSITAVLAITFSMTGNASAQESTPRIVVSLTDQWVSAENFAPYTLLTFQIFESRDSSDPFYQIGKTSDGNGSEWISSRDYDKILVPGNYIIISNGVTTKNLVLEPITMDLVDPINDTLVGTAPTSRYVLVAIFSTDTFCNMDLVSDSEGKWIADFKTKSCDVTDNMVRKSGGGAVAQIFDEDGDVSQADPPDIPRFDVRPNEDLIEGWDWTKGETITLQVGGNTIYGEVGEDPWNHSQSYISFNLSSVYDIKPGDLVSLSNADPANPDKIVTTKTTVVTNLEITGYDVVNDTFSGIAEPGARIDPAACPPDGDCIWRHVIANDSGNWFADFSKPGIQDDEKDIFDIVPGSWLDTRQADNDGDQTQYGLTVPKPQITANPQTDSVTIYGLKLGTSVVLTIDDPSFGSEVDYTNQTTMDYPWYAPDNPTEVQALFDLRGNFDLRPGDIITASGGGASNTYTVTNFSITEINVDNNTISGVASPLSKIQVCLNSGECRYPTADEFGKWTALPGDPVTYVLKPGSSGWANEYEADWDQTWQGWNAPDALQDIYIFNTQTGEVTQITNTKDRSEFHPSWSPNGKKIVYRAVESDGSLDIYIVDVKSKVSTLLADTANGNDPVWSPNGLLIAFDTKYLDQKNLYVIPVTGGHKQLIRENAISPNWSPTGLRMVFQDLADGGKLKTIGLLGKLEIKVADYGENAAWSPDGKWITYEKDGDIWKVRVDLLGIPLAKPVQLTNLASYEDQPTWTPDSKTIIYHALPMYDFSIPDADLWTVSATGGMPTWLAGAPEGYDFDPSVEKNGNLIAYSSVSANAQAPRKWISAYTYDLPAGYWTEGQHTYHGDFTYSLPSPGEDHGADVSIKVANNTSAYDGIVLLRSADQTARIGEGCFDYNDSKPITIRPDQQTRLFYGLETDAEMTYTDASAHFASLTATATLDNSTKVNLAHLEILPMSPMLDWGTYTCKHTYR
jgi:Tol biopolymer transport system component